MKIKVGLESQNLEYLKKVLKALEEVSPRDRNNSFYEVYKSELEERIKTLSAEKTISDF